jgi:hypothetical protein
METSKTISGFRPPNSFLWDAAEFHSEAGPIRVSVTGLARERTYARMAAIIPISLARAPARFEGLTKFNCPTHLAREGTHVRVLLRKFPLIPHSSFGR